MKDQTLHDEIRQMLQWVADEYGIRIDNISAEWIDTSTSEKPSFRLHGLNVDTTNI